MTVFINKIPVTIFKGALIRDVILSYSIRSYKMLQNGYLCIYDRFGNLTEPDGPVKEGQHFKLKVKKS